MGFIFSFLTAYSLAHYLTRHTTASILCGIAFAYCPFIFARTAHIQLLMTFGLPWAMHFMHRLIDRPNWFNAISLGLILVVQALACAYYGIFAGLTVGLGVLYYAYTRGLWKNRAYWGFVFVAAAISVAIVGPFFLPYIDRPAGTRLHAHDRRRQHVLRRHRRLARLVGSRASMDAGVSRESGTAGTKCCFPAS